MKSYQNWPRGKSLEQYLQVGDVVDQEMVNHFINVMPPACERETLIQIGEPADFVNGKSVYATLVREDGKWTYAGNCHRYERTQP